MQSHVDPEQAAGMQSGRASGIARRSLALAHRDSMFWGPVTTGGVGKWLINGGRKVTIIEVPPHSGRRLYRLSIARGPGEGSGMTRCNSGFLREAELEDLPPCPRPGCVGVSYRTY